MGFGCDLVEDTAGLLLSSLETRHPPSKFVPSLCRRCGACNIQGLDMMVANYHRGSNADSVTYVTYCIGCVSKHSSTSTTLDRHATMQRPRTAKNIFGGPFGLLVVFLRPRYPPNLRVSTYSLTQQTGFLRDPRLTAAAPGHRIKLVRGHTSSLSTRLQHPRSFTYNTLAAQRARCQIRSLGRRVPGYRGLALSEKRKEGKVSG